MHMHRSPPLPPIASFPLQCPRNSIPPDFQEKKWLRYISYHITSYQSTTEGGESGHTVKACSEHACLYVHVYADENNCQGTCIIFLVVLVRGGGEGEREISGHNNDGCTMIMVDLVLHRANMALFYTRWKTINATARWHQHLCNTPNQEVDWKWAPGMHSSLIDLA